MDDDTKSLLLILSFIMGLILLIYLVINLFQTKTSGPIVQEFTDGLTLWKTILF